MISPPSDLTTGQRHKKRERASKKKLIKTKKKMLGLGRVSKANKKYCPYPVLVPLFFFFFFLLLLYTARLNQFSFSSVEVQSNNYSWGGEYFLLSGVLCYFETVHPLQEKRSLFANLVTLQMSCCNMFSSKEYFNFEDIYSFINLT